MLKSILRTSLFSFILLISTPLFSEIELVTIKWTQLLCTQACINLLDKELKRVPGIAEVSLNQGAGQATLKWRPNYPFSFSDVNVPMRLVGLSIRDIHIRVRGTISHDANSVTLTSIGDNTRFQLLNPVITTPGQQTTVFNLAARQLTPELRQKLLEGEAKQAVAIVQGPIFMPGRSSALQIVIQSLTFEEKKVEKPKGS